MAKDVTREQAETKKQAAELMEPRNVSMLEFVGGFRRESE